MTATDERTGEDARRPPTEVVEYKGTMISSSARGVRDRRARIVRSHIDAENRRDVDAIVATFSPDRATYDIPAFGDDGQRSGAASIREKWAGLFAVFPDIHHDVIRLRHGDDHILVEFRVSGTQQADWAGIPAHGRPFSVRVAAIYEFDGDEPVCERTYTDLAELARQLIAPS